MSDDLYDNPMIRAAKKSLTPEQIEEYKKIGEYMYNNVDYQNISLGSKVSEASDDDMIFYATQALKSGIEPKDLSRQELQLLINRYGIEWFEQFGFGEDDVNLFSINPDDIIKKAEEKAKTLPLNKSQRKRLERKIQKEKAMLSNNK